MANVGGQIMSDRVRAAKLRRITLDQSIKIMQSEPTTKDEILFKQALHLKLAGNVLPRINEHTGDGGEAIKITVEVAGEIAEKHNLLSESK